MEFKESFQYPTDINRTWEMLSDPEYAADRAEVLKMTNPSVDSDDHERSIKRSTTGGVPQDMLPAAAKRFISPSAKVVIKEEWKRVDNDRIHGHLEVSAQGVPAGLHADVEIKAKGDVSDAKMHGEVKVNIPLLGKRLEKEAVQFAPVLAQGEVDNAKKWVAAH